MQSIKAGTSFHAFTTLALLGAFLIGAGCKPKLSGDSTATGLTPGRYFHLTATGPDSAWYCVETSSNLLDWTAVCTNQAVNGSIDYVDPNSPAKGAYYYRAVPLTSGN